jgi:pyruvate/2-oxoglutarate dehydrogenase complex dihydrolipoamide dehydrogenase (E3) component
LTIVKEVEESMRSDDYDYVVIGGGSGGYAAARTACALGLKTVVIDSAKELGGLCILKGCMPSKALIESANRARAFRHGKEFGLIAGVVKVDTESIIKRKEVLIEDFASYRQGQLESGKFDLFRGHACFLDCHTLKVTKASGQIHHLTFKSACIATGSVVNDVPIAGLKEAGFWISDDILTTSDLPDSIIVLGGGAIALEMACYLEGLGRQVMVIQRSHQLLSGFDRDVADALKQALESRPNLQIFVGTEISEVRQTSRSQKQVIFQHQGQTRSVSADQILQALGRKPNTAGLDLEKCGIEVNQTGLIACNEFQQTSVPHIFAVGDVCGPYEIVHIAIEQGEKAAKNAAVTLGVHKGAKLAMNYRLKLFGIFTDPQVAMVGLTEMEAKERGIELKVATHFFNDHGKSMIMGELHGFVKLLADSSTGKLLGGAVVGPEAVELIHEIVVAMKFGATASEFLEIPHYHPTLSEIWTYPAEDLIM